MRTKWFLGMMVSMLAVGLMAASALAGGKLLCISKQTLKGQETVSSCLAKGQEFAVISDMGIVHVLTPREVELTKAFNPQLFQQPAYSMRYRELAPEIKVFGTTIVPQKEKK
jgi:hypothetical protein